MISFFLCLALLVLGYFFYAKKIDDMFGPDDRQSPAIRINDGVDYVVMPKWKLFLIQLLNIAGLGPIFGALAGALWGPIVFLWITLGTIFAGAVHDYFSGMMSIRHDGASLSEIIGEYLGGTVKNIMRVFCVILLVMVGTVFAVGPAGLLVKLFSSSGWEASSIVTNYMFWLVIILAYYFIATFISIDKIIGKIYPIFGLALIIMAIGVAFGVVTSGSEMPELWDHFENMHPKGTPVWAFMFITVACGAISGFHATQSPLMARCASNEYEGRLVFAGAMYSEGIIALIWAAAGCALYPAVNGLNTGLAGVLASGQAAATYDVCSRTMGGIGIALAMLGVVACPITSGDTAFRSARLLIADWIGLKQDGYKNRLILCVPLLLAGALISQLDYAIVWRYFSWSNQTLSMITLWAASMYLVRNHKNYWFTAVPATFMTAVSVTYFCMAKECLGLVFTMPASVAYVIGVVVAGLFLFLFLNAVKKIAK